MNRDQTGIRDQSADLRAPHAAEDALLRWDELDEQLLKLLADDPERGRRLRKLQDADGWLRARASEAAQKRTQQTAGQNLLECPPAEELYDFGQGPGASTLGAARMEAIDRHLATCSECERFVATLTTPPPSPLILGMPAESESTKATPVVHVAPRPRPARRLRLVAACAAAAAVVAIALIVHENSSPTLRFPDAPLLRGSAGGPLLYPRDHVLLASPAVCVLFPALAAPLEFEVEPQADAEEYRFDVSRHEGGAFGRDVSLPGLRASTPTAKARQPREAGHFTFEAWATVRGLDQRLGAHGFEVLADADLDAQLLALANRPVEERTLAAVVLLHGRGFATDARALARTLPASAERDRYLGQPPGR